MNKLQLTDTNPGSFNTENSIFEKIKTFKNCLIDFSEQHLEIWNGGENKVYETDLKLKDKNPFAVTYIGRIEENTFIRVILSPDMIQRICQDEQATGEPDLITFGSMSGDGFAVHFNLVHSDNPNSTQFKESLDSAFFKSDVQSKAEALIYLAKDVLSLDAEMAKDYISRFSKLLENDTLEIIKFDSIENILLGYKLGIELGIFKPDDVIKIIRNMEFLFVSSKHLRIEDNKILKGYSDDPDGYINYETLIRIIPNFDEKKGFNITIENPDFDHPFWRDICPLPRTTMDIISKSKNTIKFGFTDLPILTINLSGKNIESIIYHRKKTSKTREGNEIITIDMKYLK